MGFDSLIRFGNQIGLEMDELSKAEKLDILYLRKKFFLQALKDISLPIVKELLQSFGNALTLRIGDDIDNLSLVEKGKPLPCIKAKLDRIQRLSPGMELYLELVIEKKTLLKNLGLVEEEYHSLLYIFKKNLINFLESPLPALDEYLFSDPYKPTIIMLYEDNSNTIHYHSVSLTIAGVGAMEIFRSEFSSIGANAKIRIEKFRTTAENTLNWKGFEFKRITPMHFLCDRKSAFSGAMNTILCSHLLHSCILYMANRSVYEKFERNFQATFTSSTSERTLSFPNRPGDTVIEDQRLLSQLATWPFSGKGDERLSFFQTVLTLEIDNDNPDKNFGEFCIRLKHLLRQACWHYKVFIDGKIDKHFEQVQKVTDYVTCAAQEVGRTLDSVTKGLTDTLLASIGIIVLTILAALVKKETRGDIFKIAMWAYASYLCIFQLLYRLGSILHGYLLLKEGTEERLKEYSNALTRKKVEGLTFPLERRKRQFWIWFIVTVFAYLIVILLILILANKSPRIWYN